MIKKVTIYGERCSGTNYLEELLIINFNVEIIWSYGWKHFFGFNNLDDSDDVLFIGIIRNIFDWINSLYINKHHLPKELTDDIDKFLNNTFYSINHNNTEILKDRNIETNNRYNNIFESRHIKNKFLIECMPKLVNNYCLITYDDLIDNFINTMYKIKNHNLEFNMNLKEFPQNIDYYKKDKNTKYFKNELNIIKKDIILNKANLYYEKILFPNLFYS